MELIDILKRDALVLASARRIIKAPKRTSNRSLVYNLFGYGSTSAVKHCEKLGLDPDCNKTSYDAMCKFIDENNIESLSNDVPVFLKPNQAG